MFGKMLKPILVALVLIAFFVVPAGVLFGERLLDHGCTPLSKKDEGSCSDYTNESECASESVYREVTAGKCIPKVYGTVCVKMTSTEDHGNASCKWIKVEDPPPKYGPKESYCTTDTYSSSDDFDDCTQSDDS